MRSGSKITSNYKGVPVIEWVGGHDRLSPLLYTGSNDTMIGK